MEKFLNLPVEKQNIIIDAALKNFAVHGYKKTSISDIASSAGISKAMVFHYFGTKKELYVYLVRMRSPVQIRIAAPQKPVLPQGIAGFCFPFGLG